MIGAHVLVRTRHPVYDGIHLDPGNLVNGTLTEMDLHLEMVTVDTGPALVVIPFSNISGITTEKGDPK